MLVRQAALTLGAAAAMKGYLDRSDVDLFAGAAVVVAAFAHRWWKFWRGRKSL